MFLSGSIGLWPPTMAMISGGIKKEAPLSLRHVERVIAAVSPGESLQSVVHGFCFLTSPDYVSIAKNAWYQAATKKVYRASDMLGNTIMYSCTEREGQMGKCLAHFHGVRTELSKVHAP